MTQPGHGEQARDLLPGSVRVGRVAGVQVSIHWSVLAVFTLLAVGLSSQAFPDRYPARPGWAYALAGIGTALVFLVGLLVHELAHAVVATREGLPVDGITLWLLGGVASLRGEARDPAAEVRVAGAGPLASVALALLFGVLAALLALTGADGLLVGAVAWLSGINLALALFNILPAAPLDGGRLLRAALWRWRGDRRWAAIVSARAGRVLGGALLAIGLWQFLFTVNGIGGLWLALLGWFLVSAATVEEREVVIGQALSGLRVWQIMSPYPATAPPDINVADFLDQYLFRHRFSSFPLVSEEHPVGLVTLNPKFRAL